jgi:hypothetical protein
MTDERSAPTTPEPLSDLPMAVTEALILQIGNAVLEVTQGHAAGSSGRFTTSFPVLGAQWTITHLPVIVRGKIVAYTVVVTQHIDGGYHPMHIAAAANTLLRYNYSNVEVATTGQGRVTAIISM